MAGSSGTAEIIAAVSAFISLGAMAVAWMQARYARDAAAAAKRQADAALGEVDPLIFLSSAPFERPQSTGGRALLTVVNQNRRDIRLLEIQFRTDPSIVVSLDTDDPRDIIAAAFQRSRKGDTEPLKIDFRDDHLLVEGNSIGTASSRKTMALALTIFGDRRYAGATADLTAIVCYELLDARHVERRVEVFATVPFR
jgi:hypothetical protein